MQRAQVGILAEARFRILAQLGYAALSEAQKGRHLALRLSLNLDHIQDLPTTLSERHLHLLEERPRITAVFRVSIEALEFRGQSFLTSGEIVHVPWRGGLVCILRTSKLINVLVCLGGAEAKLRPL